MSPQIAKGMVAFTQEIVIFAGEKTLVRLKVCYNYLVVAMTEIDYNPLPLGRFQVIRTTKGYLTN